MSENNTWQTVKQVLLTDEPLSAYNLTVNHNHTYFVSGTPNGKYQAFGVWVHNDCLISKVDTLWAVGGHNSSAMQNLQKHFKKHGKELGSTDIGHYMRQAEGFKKNLKGASKNEVKGYNENVTRYKKNGKYIDLTADGKIVSFGKQ